MSTKEVFVFVGHQVLAEVNDNSALIVGNPCGILGQQFLPRPIKLLNIFIFISYFIILCYTYIKRIQVPIL
jgi:hypothetical protein